MLEQSPGVLGKIRQTLFSISSEQATFAKRGFYPTNHQTQQHLERIGKTFLEGYQIAIALSNPDRVIPQLNRIESEYRGFAFEGAAMGLALLDCLTFSNCARIKQFLATEGQNHIYMTYVGMGWLLGRLPRLFLQSQFNLFEKAKDDASHTPDSPTFRDPLLGWLTIDGYGFHQGYFNWRTYVQGILPPQNLSGYSCRVFDQGLGRSLWFVKGANLDAIQVAIAQFQPDRRADLWSGIGLACAYAGGVEKAAIEGLRNLAQSYYPELAQGVTFAAKTRLRAGNLTENTEIAAQILCGMSAQKAAAITDSCLEDLSYGQTVPAYEQWRLRIQQHFI
ncbi:MAG TPA: hypothetical protein DCF68_13050 [Cyanothece sp. UBA12306]|nr:hypothetical protein [Cyanothece sp. UBA12306]